MAFGSSRPRATMRRRSRHMRANKRGDAPQLRFGVVAVTAEAGRSLIPESAEAWRVGTSKPAGVFGLQKKSPPSFESGLRGSVDGVKRPTLSTPVVPSLEVEPERELNLTVC